MGILLAAGVQGADDLRKELGLDEPNFRHLSPNLNGEPKKYSFIEFWTRFRKPR